MVITDVGGGHDDPASQAEYASLPTEMKAVAAELGVDVLRKVTLKQIVEKIPSIREKTGDRAILRAYHFSLFFQQNKFPQLLTQLSQNHQ